MSACHAWQPPHCIRTFTQDAKPLISIANLSPSLPHALRAITRAALLFHELRSFLHGARHSHAATLPSIRGCCMAEPSAPIQGQVFDTPLLSRRSIFAKSSRTSFHNHPMSRETAAVCSTFYECYAHGIGSPLIVGVSAQVGALHPLVEIGTHEWRNRVSGCSPVGRFARYTIFHTHDSALPPNHIPPRKSEVAQKGAQGAWGSSDRGKGFALVNPFRADIQYFNFLSP